MNDLEALQARIKGDESELKKFTWPGGWPGEIEAALIDAVFSIRARYGTGENGVRGVVKRWRDERGDVLDDLRALANPTGHSLADVADNRSTTGGQLKAIAVQQAAAQLVAADIRTSADLASRESRDKAKRAYTSVRGLGWVTYSYFLMLLGMPDVKSDVHIRRYVATAIGVGDVSAERARSLLLGVSLHSFKDATHLDHAIWKLQQSRLSS